MKKLITLITSLLIFTACSDKNVEQVTETQTESITSSAVTVNTTETITTTEATETTVSMEEIKLEEMTIKYDSSMWETLDEFIKRLEESGDTLDDETINEMKNMGNVTLAVRGTDASILWVDAFPYDGIEGFGTKEDYELFGLALEYLQQQSNEDVSSFKSEIRERNGIMFSESSTWSNGTYVMTCNILKDNIQYSFFLTNVSRSEGRKLINELIDNISFD